MRPFPLNGSCKTSLRSNPEDLNSRGLHRHPRYTAHRPCRRAEAAGAYPIYTDGRCRAVFRSERTPPVDSFRYPLTSDARTHLRTFLSARRHSSDAASCPIDERASSAVQQQPRTSPLPNEHVAQFNSADISRRNHHLQMRRRSVSGFNPVLTIIVQQCRAIRYSRFRHDIKRLSQRSEAKICLTDASK